jgi:hypothetical protein
MKALVSALALLSFVGASTLPVVAEAATKTTQGVHKVKKTKKTAKKKTAKKMAHKKAAKRATVA